MLLNISFSPKAEIELLEIDVLEFYSRMSKNKPTIIIGGNWGNNSRKPQLLRRFESNELDAMLHYPCFKYFFILQVYFQFFSELETSLLKNKISGIFRHSKVFIFRISEDHWVVFPEPMIPRISESLSVF